MDVKLNVSPECATSTMRANRTRHGDINTSTAGRLREVIILLCSALVRPHLA